VGNAGQGAAARQRHVEGRAGIGGAAKLRFFVCEGRLYGLLGLAGDLAQCWPLVGGQFAYLPHGLAQRAFAPEVANAQIGKGLVVRGGLDFGNRRRLELSDFFYHV
jgi:hypothetical protein